jgi:hypothetical protein
VTALVSRRGERLNCTARRKARAVRKPVRHPSGRKELYELSITPGGRHRADHRAYGRVGGASILSLLIADPSYAQNDLRQDPWRAGHAHAGVWLVLSLVALRYVDEATLSEGMRWVVRVAFPVAAVLPGPGLFPFCDTRGGEVTQHYDLPHLRCGGRAGGGASGHSGEPRPRTPDAARRHERA